MSLDSIRLSGNMAQTLPPLIPRRRQPSSSQSDPGPATPSLPPPPLLESLHFKIPCRRILSPQDLEIFSNSETRVVILAFLFGISDSVKGLTVSGVAAEQHSSPVQSILAVLDDTKELLKSYPPVDTGSRFGNPAFRSYVSAVTNKLKEWHRSRFDIPEDSIDEIATYISNSFGSASRIDYGSGHELNFFLWLLALNRLGQTTPSDFPALALVVFPRYLSLMRQIQVMYYLEPAGSHGVWGLDDYQFVPFLFGAAQLVGHKFITPKTIHNQPTVEEFAKDYLYLDQISFINSVKNVDGLRWHSPMLDDISSAKSWDKIEVGMKKMFVKEVLGKLPVMQHFLFGSLIPAAPGMSEEEQIADATEAAKDHQHNLNSWGDCCGIRVPGTVGASGEAKRAGGSTLRRIPFD
jgi:serine/threonine-protein phosphatase 2A activator